MLRIIRSNSACATILLITCAFATAQLSSVTRIKGIARDQAGLEKGGRLIACPLGLPLAALGRLPVALDFADRGQAPAKSSNCTVSTSPKDWFHQSVSKGMSHLYPWQDMYFILCLISDGTRSTSEAPQNPHPNAACRGRGAPACGHQDTDRDRPRLRRVPQDDQPDCQPAAYPAAGCARGRESHEHLSESSGA